MRQVGCERSRCIRGQKAAYPLQASDCAYRSIQAEVAQPLAGRETRKGVTWSRSGWKKRRIGIMDEKMDRNTYEQYDY